MLVPSFRGKRLQTKLAILLVATFFILWSSNTVDALCCPCNPGFFPWAGTCDDGTGCRMYSCCATGGCDIFCCNCDGHCLRRSMLTNTTLGTATTIIINTYFNYRGKRELPGIDNGIYHDPLKDESNIEAVNSAVTFVAIDLDNDRRIAFNEAEAYVYSQQPRRVSVAKALVEGFTSMDTDNDGYISLYEFDGYSKLMEAAVNWFETKRDGKISPGKDQN